MKVMCMSNDDTMPLSLLMFCGVGPVASFHTSSDAYRDCFHRDCFHRDCLFFHDYFLIGSVIIVIH